MHGVLKWYVWVRNPSPSTFFFFKLILTKKKKNIEPVTLGFVPLMKF